MRKILICFFNTISMVLLVAISCNMYSFAKDIDGTKSFSGTQNYIYDGDTLNFSSVSDDNYDGVLISLMSGDIKLSNIEGLDETPVRAYKTSDASTGTSSYYKVTDKNIGLKIKGLNIDRNHTSSDTNHLCYIKSGNVVGVSYTDASDSSKKYMLYQIYGNKVEVLFYEFLDIDGNLVDGNRYHSFVNISDGSLSSSIYWRNVKINDSNNDYLGFVAKGNGKISDLVEYDGNTYGASFGVSAAKYQEYAENYVVYMYPQMAPVKHIAYYLTTASANPVNNNYYRYNSSEYTSITTLTPDTRQGYSFLYWKEESNFYDTFEAGSDINLDSVFPNQYEIMFRGYWEPYKLTLDLNGGSKATSTETEYTYDSGKTSFTIPGYKDITNGNNLLVGWSDAEGTLMFTTVDSSGDVNENFEFNMSNLYSNDVTLKAVWAPYVKFEFNDGSSTVTKYCYTTSECTPNSFSYESGSLTSEDESLEYLGWVARATGKSDKITSNSSTTYSYDDYVDYVIDNTVKLTPYFHQKMKVNYDFNAPTGTSYSGHQDSIYVEDSGRIYFPKPNPISGFSFVGWSNDYNSEIVDSRESDKYISRNGSGYGNGDVYTLNLKGNWVKDVTITYHGVDGSILDTSTYHIYDGGGLFQLFNANSDIIAWTPHSDGSGTSYPNTDTVSYNCKDFPYASLNLYAVSNSADPAFNINNMGRMKFTSIYNEFSSKRRFKVDSDPTIYNTQKFYLPYLGYFTFTAQ